MVHDFCVIGGGIVGLAAALELTRAFPHASLVLLEKEADVGQHQSGHNSGVIHAGVYYKPGSLKARLCREGAEATKRFCDEHGIPYETRGKLIVASDAAEMRRLADLEENARANGIDIERLDGTELRRREPNVVGEGALFVRSTGIVDYRRVCAKLAELLSGKAEVVLNAEVDGIVEQPGEVIVSAGGRSWSARSVVVCGGLQSDRLARLSGMTVTHQVVPFRGEYYQLRPERADLVHHLIYPVPDPALPFLGIHLTPTMDGELTIGPNAVLGFSREGYAKLSFDLRDVATFAGFGGFWRVLGQHWRSALDEAGNSLFKRQYLRKCQKYCPDLSLDDLQPYRAGIRAQAVLADGTLVHDFLLLQSDRILHVANAPSPAATSAIPIGRMIAEQVANAHAARN